MLPNGGPQTEAAHLSFEDLTIPEARDVKPGDFVLFFEAYGDAKSARNVMGYLCEVDQLSAHDGAIRACAPTRQESHDFYVKKGNPMGWLHPGSVLYASKVSVDEYMPGSTSSSFDKGRIVKVCLAKAGNTRYLFNGTVASYQPDFRAYIITFSSADKTLNANLMVQEANVFPIE